MPNIIETDVLIIGGGGAAARAAVEAAKQCKSVVMVMKGEFGKCGATAYKVAEIAGYNAAITSPNHTDSPNKHYEDILRSAHGMCDVNLAKILADEAPQSFHELEDLGVEFKKNNGDYLRIQGCFSSFPRTHIIYGHSEPILSALKRKILDIENIRIIENTLITNLIIKGSNCIGAIGFNKNGETIGFRSGSIALSTGGAGQLFLHNLNPPDITGDGYAMALRAGAELVNMEFMQAGLGIVRPRVNIFNGWIWSLHPRMINLQGEEFINHYLPKGISYEKCMDDKSTHYPFSTFDNSSSVEISVHKEIMSGRGTTFNSVFVDLRNVDLDNQTNNLQGLEANKMWGITKSWMIKSGIDPDDELIHISTFGHAINGGVRINGQTKSTIDGLFAAGETAGGPHGADRLGGNMILTCQVFGKRMGHFAAHHAAQQSNQVNISAEVDEETKRLKDLVNYDGKYSLSEIEHKLKTSMWENVLVVRNRSKLENCLANIQQLQEDLYSNTQISSASDIWAAVELQNMIDVGKIIIQSSLMREESRGSHYREDFPKQNDKDWLKNIIITQQNEKVCLFTDNISNSIIK